MIRIFILALLLGTAWYMPGAARADSPKSAEQQQIDQLQLQLQAVQAQLKQLAEQNQVLLQKMQQLLPAASAASQPPAVSATSAPESPLSNFKLWGYGEVYYADPTHNGEKAQVCAGISSIHHGS